MLTNEFWQALSLGSDQECKQQGLEYIQVFFLSNRYLSMVIKRRERKAKFLVKKKAKKRVFLSLPFSSKQQMRAICNIARKYALDEHICINQREIVSKGNCQFCDPDDGDCWSKEYVYFINCLLCDAFYIGDEKNHAITTERTFVVWNWCIST